MAEVIFSFKGTNTIIQCNIQDKIEIIIKKFIEKSNLVLNQLLFLYGGNKIQENDDELTFENLANSDDLERKKINILVYSQEMYKSTPDFIMTEYIDNIKPKIHFILSKYLDDRKYIENSVDKWKDAILNECNSIFVSNKEYKAFIYLMIKDEKQKQKDFSRNWDRDYKYYIPIKFKTNSIFGFIIIILLKRDRKRINKDISNSFKIIKNEFLNLAEGRNYEIFKSKYFKMVKQKIIEIRKEYGTELFIFYELSNKNIIATRGFIISNKGKNDCYLSELIKVEDYSFYLLLAKVNN